MDIRAYMLPGCGACERQAGKMDLSDVDVVTDRGEMSGIRGTPTIDVSCDNGTRHRFVGVTEPSDIRGVCEK